MERCTAKKNHVELLKRILLTAMVLCLTAGMAAADAAWSFPIEITDINDAYLVLANDAEPLSEDYVPGNLTKLKTRRLDEFGSNISGGMQMATSGTIALNEEAAEMLYFMTNEAEVAYGLNIFVRQGYRSYKDELTRYTRLQAKGIDSDIPGKTDYQTGLAVILVGEEHRTGTLDQSYLETPVAQWLLENCAHYGFVVRYPEGKEAETGHEYEPWHLRYVGVKVAQYMAEEGMSLEGFHSAYDKALNKFVTDGGDLEAAQQVVTYPDGPVVLEITDEDGDHEIILFHD